MTRTIDEFMARCTSFARRHPDAVLEMLAPELAVDPRAPAHHLRRTCETARQRMFMTAKLARKSSSPVPDLFDDSAASARTQP